MVASSLTGILDYMTPEQIQETSYLDPVSPAYQGATPGSNTCQCIVSPCNCSGWGGTGGGDSTTDLRYTLPAWYNSPLPGSGVSIIDQNEQTVGSATVTGKAGGSTGLSKNTLWMLAAAALVVVVVANRD